MIIVRLIGGLGNQMFQYALGRALALQHQTSFKLDISGFDQYHLRRYGLDVFQIRAEIASGDDIDSVLGGNRLSRKWIRFVDGFYPYYSRRRVIENGFCFDPNIRLIRDTAYLDGYWQSHRYFLGIRDILLDEFSVVSPSRLNIEMGKQIQAQMSVSIHIRRGDYVSNPHTLQAHGICPLSYYIEAVKVMTHRVLDPYFYIFSDDPQWVKDHLHLDYPVTYVSHNSLEDGYEDLGLMRLCKHHIIANSSFSWWGAWLNPSTEKIVIAPQQWFGQLAHSTADLIPANWDQI